MEKCNFSRAVVFDGLRYIFLKGKNPPEGFKKRKKVEDFMRKALAFFLRRCYNHYDLRVCFTRERGFPPLFLIEKGRIL